MNFHFVQKMEVNQHITRSVSVPVNIKAANLRRTDSRRLVRVISARSLLTNGEGISTQNASGSEIGNLLHNIWNLYYIFLSVSLFKFFFFFFSKVTVRCLASNIFYYEILNRKRLAM